MATSRHQNLLTSAIEQARKVNPSVNALTGECYEQAQRRAVDRVELKNGNSVVEGLPFPHQGP